ncbi:MAG: hypothetical protein ACK5IJ_01250 [Mangrovibacterium sp.]
MLLLLIISLFCFWKDNFLAIWISGGLFFVGLSLMQFFQINYIYYNSSDSTLILRYHPTSSLFSNKYESIDFDKSLLYSAKINRSNIFADLSILIRTQRGILEYPDVSLVGLTAIEIDLIEQDLQNIIVQNKAKWQQN